MQAISDQSRIVRIPLNRSGLLNKIRKAQAGLEQDLGRAPAISELSAFMEVEEKELLMTMQAGVRHVSTDQPVGTGDDITLLDLLVDGNKVSPDEDLILESFRTEVGRSLETLSNRERETLILFFGIGQAAALSLSEIGEKFDLTRERVRQIKEKALRRLRKDRKNQNLRPYLGG
jgi:RNA polymerase primary sigma factor